MPTEFAEWGGHCDRCQRQSLFRSTRDRPSHILHAFLAFVSFGLWIIPWLVISAGSGKQSPWRCTQCGWEHPD